MFVNDQQVDAKDRQTCNDFVVGRFGNMHLNDGVYLKKIISAQINLSVEKLMHQRGKSLQAILVHELVVSDVECVVMEKVRIGKMPGYVIAAKERLPEQVSANERTTLNAVLANKCLKGFSLFGTRE